MIMRSMGDRGRLAIVCDSVEWGGTERVVDAVAERYSEAPILATHFPGMPGAAGPAAPPWAPRARLVHSPHRRRHFLAPVHARRMATAPLAPADVVLCFAHGGWSLAVGVPPGARMVCYSAGLPSALYERRDLYLRDYPAPLRVLARAAVPALRVYERRLMRRPDRLVTNSRASAAAIERVHGRRADVIHPPVRTAFFTPADTPRRHALAVGRIAPQKGFDVLLDAFRELPGERLVIVGRGPWLERLRRSAPPNVHLAGWVSDAELRELYRSSWALVCPSVEDFGLVMGEAHACGVPVIAPRAGGALEIVDDPATGILLERMDPPSVARAARAVRRGRFDARACRASAERFAAERFVARLDRVIEEELALVRGGSGAALKAARRRTIPAWPRGSRSSS